MRPYPQMGYGIMALMKPVRPLLRQYSEKYNEQYAIGFGTGDVSQPLPSARGSLLSAYGTRLSGRSIRNTGWRGDKQNGSEPAPLLHPDTPDPYPGRPVWSRVLTYTISHRASWRRRYLQ